MYTLRSDAEAPCRNHVKAYQFPVRAGQSASSPSRNARPSTPSPLRIVNQPQHTVMAAFAPPVHRDKFLYSSVLYADAGSDNHHPRASITELTALLRPEAPKAKRAKHRKSLSQSGILHGIFGPRSSFTMDLLPRKTRTPRRSDSWVL